MQRTIKRAELWAFTPAGLIGPSTIILTGHHCWTVEVRTGIHWTKATRCGFMDQKLWELLTECAESNWDLDAKHVMAHTTVTEKKAMTKEPQFVLEGNEKATELDGW